MVNISQPRKASNIVNRYICINLYNKYYYCPTSNHSHKHMERGSVDVLYNHKITDEREESNHILYS